jgi:hypothetical protein
VDSAAAFVESARLLLRLHGQYVLGASESAEADAIRDAMDAPWARMDAEHRELHRELSAALHVISDRSAQRTLIPRDRTLVEVLRDLRARAALVLDAQWPPASAHLADGRTVYAVKEDGSIRALVTAESAEAAIERHHEVAGSPPPGVIAWVDPAGGWVEISPAAPPVHCFFDQGRPVRLSYKPEPDYAGDDEELGYPTTRARIALARLGLDVELSDDGWIDEHGKRCMDMPPPAARKARK